MSLDAQTRNCASSPAEALTSPIVSFNFIQNIHMEYICSVMCKLKHSFVSTCTGKKMLPWCTYSSFQSIIRFMLIVKKQTTDRVQLCCPCLCCHCSPLLVHFTRLAAAGENTARRGGSLVGAHRSSLLHPQSLRFHLISQRFVRSWRGGGRTWRRGRHRHHSNCMEQESGGAGWRRVDGKSSLQWVYGEDSR